jgi:hypothetical protein
MSETTKMLEMDENHAAGGKQKPSNASPSRHNDRENVDKLTDKLFRRLSFRYSTRFGSHEKATFLQKTRRTTVKPASISFEFMQTLN